MTNVLLSCADGIPIVIRVWKHNNFEPGPFRLGMLQLPINLLSIAWVITTTVGLSVTAVPSSLHPLPTAPCLFLRCF